MTRKAYEGIQMRLSASPPPPLCLSCLVSFPFSLLLPYSRRQPVCSAAAKDTRPANKLTRSEKEGKKEETRRKRDPSVSLDASSREAEAWIKS